MVNCIKYIFLTCLLFLISETSLPNDPPARDSLPTSKPSIQTQEMTEGTRACFTYLLHKEERIDIDVENIVEYVAIRKIEKITRTLTNKEAMKAGRKAMRERLLFIESLGVTREQIRDIAFPGLPLSSLDEFMDNDDGNDQVH